MKIRFIKLLCLLLAGLMLVLPLTACGNDSTATDTTVASTDQGAESDPVQSAINPLRNDVDWEGKEFGILYVDDLAGYKEELEAMAEYSGNSSNAVINDAVFERNTLFEEYCNLKFVLIPTPNPSIGGAIMGEVQTGTGDFHLITTTTDTAANKSLWFEGIYKNRFKCRDNSIVVNTNNNKTTYYKKNHHKWNNFFSNICNSLKTAKGNKRS